MGGKVSLEAAEYFDYVKYVLEIYSKSFSSVVAIVGDNTATNKSFARRFGPFSELQQPQI